MSESGDGQDHGGTPRPDALIPALDEGQVAAPNAVPSFKPAEWRNARITLGWMIGLLIAMFGGVLVITLLAGIVPVASQTMLSQLARDRQAPRSFLRIGDRLTFRNGILLLSVTSAALYGVGRVAVDDSRVGVRDGQLLFRPGKSRDVMAGAERLCCPAFKMPMIGALEMPMIGDGNAPPVGSRGVLVGVVPVVVGEAPVSVVDLGDGGAGGCLVDDGLAGGVGGDEGGRARLLTARG